LVIISEGRRFLSDVCFQTGAQERSLEARPALSLDAETRHLGRSWLGAALDGLDSRLRLRQGVITARAASSIVARIFSISLLKSSSLLVGSSGM
jgi:hypothetical protein